MAYQAWQPQRIRRGNSSHSLEQGDQSIGGRLNVDPAIIDMSMGSPSGGGASAALAYEAATVAESRASAIERHIVVPRVTLTRLLESAGTPGSDGL